MNVSTTAAEAGSHIDASWWPKENVWKTSGMYVGYWTDANENWFRKRAAEIQGGTAQPIASQLWKSKLSNKRSKTKAILRNAENLAIRSLS